MINLKYYKTLFLFFCSIFNICSINVQFTQAREIIKPQNPTELLNGIYHYSEFTKQECQENKYMEVFGLLEILQMTSQFNYEILEKIYHDNMNHSTFLLKKGSNELDRYASHLKWFCLDAYQTCVQLNPLLGSFAMQQKNWCLQRTSDLIELQTAKLYYILVLNQSRKERMLMEETLNSLGMNFRRYLHNESIGMLVSLERFVVKVNFLIQNPVR